MPFSIATLNVENLKFPKDPDTADSERRRKRLQYYKDLYPIKVRMIRRLLRRLDADIVAIQELIDKEALDDVIKGFNYTQKQIGAPAGRGIRCALIAKNTVSLGDKIEPEPEVEHDLRISRGVKIQLKIKWDRPLLEVPVVLPGETNTLVFVVHLKSQLATRIPQGVKDRQYGYTWKTLGYHAQGNFLSAVRRVGQAMDLRQILDKRLKEDLNRPIVVLGDFNGNFHSPTVKTVVGDRVAAGNPDLLEFEMVPCELVLPESQRYTYIYEGCKNMLDHILITKNLASRLKGMRILNESLKDEHIPFRSEVYFPEPDHAPIVVEFE
ncbi:endonuclease/exonuclease/phosphatase family protein [candidate division WOR-3 bacterium]|nr:endonuclease/exonuclease/phosphatase family protein [candidate division WOR-3 bacterium]